MALPITQRQIDAFRKECAELVKNEFTFNSVDSEVTGEKDEDGKSMWEYHFDNNGESGNEEGVQESTHDIYDLFKAVSDEFTFEEDGWDEFYVTRKN